MSQNFALNLILEFLKLTDIVKILTIAHTSRVKIIPSALLLSEILQKAILLDIPFLFTSREALLPTLQMMSEDKTLTLQSIRKLCTTIKGSITSEMKPSNSITFNDRLCTFWNHAGEEDRIEALNFKISFASSQCSDQECNQIVLWHCCVCENPCSECSYHVTMCLTCDEGACTSCLLTDSIRNFCVCKNCAFICVECGKLIVEAESSKYICNGSKAGRSCSSAPGPYCADCVWPQPGDLKVWTCVKCDRMVCMECACMENDCMMYCDMCSEKFCNGCKQWGICSKCSLMTCMDCRPMMYFEEVRETLYINQLAFRSYPLIFSFISLFHFFFQFSSLFPFSIKICSATIVN